MWRRVAYKDALCFCFAVRSTHVPFRQNYYREVNEPTMAKKQQRFGVRFRVKTYKTVPDLSSLLISEFLTKTKITLLPHFGRHVF